MKFSVKDKSLIFNPKGFEEGTQDYIDRMEYVKEALPLLEAGYGNMYIMGAIEITPPDNWDPLWLLTLVTPRMSSYYNRLMYEMYPRYPSLFGLNYIPTCLFEWALRQVYLVDGYVRAKVQARMAVQWNYNPLVLSGVPTWWFIAYHVALYGWNKSEEEATLLISLLEEHLLLPISSFLDVWSSAPSINDLVGGMNKFKKPYKLVSDYSKPSVPSLLEDYLWSLVHKHKDFEEYPWLLKNNELSRVMD